VSKIYVAFTPTGARIASSSATILREKVRVYPDTQWSVYLYQLKGNIDTMVLMMEGDLTKLPAPQPLEHWKINASGQVRKFDPAKAILG